MCILYVLIAKVLKSVPGQIYVSASKGIVYDTYIKNIYNRYHA